MPLPSYRAIDDDYEIGTTNNSSNRPPIRNKIIGACLIAVALLVLSFAIMYSIAWSTDDSIGRYQCGQTGPLFKHKSNRNVNDAIWNASTHEFPFYAVLYDDRTNRSFCSGAIIYDEWLLTSAHCLVKRSTDLSNIKLSIGIISKNEMIQSSRNVIKIIIHENYEFPSRSNDIALVQIEKKIPINHSFPNPICLEPQKSIIEKKQKNQLVIGFGIRFDDDATNPDLTANDLRATRVHLPDGSICKKKYGDIVYNNKSMICVNHWNTTEKHQIGDSGGPLFYLSSSNNYVLTGINTRSAEKRSALYIRVNQFYDWIRRVTTIV